MPHPSPTESLPRIRMVAAPLHRLFSQRSLFPLYWIGLSTLVVIVDFLLGPYVQFPIFYLVPVGLASWFSGLRWGLPLAVLLSVVRLYFALVWDAPWHFGYSVANAVIRIVVLGGLALLLHRLARQERELEQRVETLEGLLPICSGCKMIRDEQDQWHPLEGYISERTNAEFTHGLCPTCIQRYFDGYGDADG